LHFSPLVHLLERALAFILARRRSDWLLLALFAASLWAANAFAEVADDVHEGDMRGADIAVRAWFQDHRSPTADAILGFVSTLGSKPVLVVVALGVGWLLARNFTFLVILALCGFVAATSVDLLKEGFAITRPETGMLERKSFAFPSGHVSGTAALAVLLAFMALRRKRWRVVTCSVAAAMVILMAVSRVYLDMHWLSDVLGGTLVGTALGLGFAALYVVIRHRLVRRSSQRGTRVANQHESSEFSRIEKQGSHS
jgi:membrane-associated phospholipid phosphatase